MCNEKIETIVSNLEMANKWLHEVIEGVSMPEHEHQTIIEACNMIKHSIRILSDEEISIEIQNLSNDE